MIGNVTLCDSCKESTENRHDGWVRVASGGVHKSADFNGVLPTPPSIGTVEYHNNSPLDFCSWRCFRKYWRGK